MDDSTPKRAVTFVVAFTVAPQWIADGFVLTDERAKSMLAREIKGGHGNELFARVIHVSETPTTIFGKYQGYKGAGPIMEVQRFLGAAPLWRMLRLRLRSVHGLCALSRPTEKDRLAVSKQIDALRELISPIDVPQQD